MFEIVDAIGDIMVNVVDKAARTSSDVEVHEILCRFSTDSIAKVAFGLDGNCLNDSSSKFRKHGKEIVDLSVLDLLKFFFKSSFPSFARSLHLTANKGSVIKFFYKTFIDSLEERERSELIRKDFMQILIDLKKTAGLTNSELAAESFLFFLAGQETLFVS